MFTCYTHSPKDRKVRSQSMVKIFTTVLRYLFGGYCGQNNKWFIALFYLPTLHKTRGRFPEIGLPLHHPFLFIYRKDFPINNPAIGVYTHLWKPQMIMESGVTWDTSNIPNLVMTNGLLLKMAIEIVSFPIKHGGSFHNNVNVSRG